jgi:glutaredoxin-like protein NrdH
MNMNSIKGKDEDKIFLYTLSTCVWCKKTRQFLEDLGYGYRYIEVDGLAGEERENALAEMKQWNPRCSFPSVVINQATCIVGFDEKKIREALGQ